MPEWMEEEEGKKRGVGWWGGGRTREIEKGGPAKEKRKREVTFMITGSRQK